VSSRHELQAELAEQMQAFQARVDAFDELVAVRLGVNRTDLRCVEILMAQRTASPGELGPALGLTTGGVTAMLIRLERLGYLRRVPHPEDGRKVIVEITDEALRQVAELYEGNLERVRGLD
jgi:DNA-binding MarR family transcriptional regulator